MIYVLIGIAAFVLFIVYDINSIIMKNKFLNGCFFAGNILLIVATAGIIFKSRDAIKMDVLRIVFFGIFTLLFFSLLIYTLFFALPFKNTYIETDSSPKVCQSGVYALCRHPGVLWFAGFFIFLGLTLNIPLLLTAAVIFSLLNTLYVIFQDQWTFMKIFENYDEYKINTPFLLPNTKSIKRCLQNR
jgi:protein-S-isoprenylcysteine O-methyltransferase Ste14